MRTLLKKYLITTISIYLVTQFRTGLFLETGLNNLFFASLILSILLIIKPFIDAVMFPINLLTLNLTAWITYIIFIYLWTLATPEVSFLAVNFSRMSIGPVILGPMMIPYWASVVINSIFIILIIKFLNWILK